MKNLFTLALLALFFFWINWFIQFQRDPYNYCRDHDNKRLRAAYYQCWPGDFEMRKGILEKHLETPWMTKDIEREKEKELERRHQLERIDDAGMQQPELERLERTR